jgi:hypothetical protein
MTWTPDTIGALIIIVGGLSLRFAGIDSEVWSVVLIAVGWLFGGQYQARKLSKGGK